MSWLEEQLAGREPRNGRHFLVAIDGRGGSGKSTLLAHLVERTPRALVACFGDDYFEPRPDGVAWGSFNDARFLAEVLEPIGGGAATYARRPFVWDRGRIEDAGSVAIPERGAFAVERCGTFALPAPWDLRIWVETPRHVCLERGLARDAGEGHRARQAWEQVWQPREDTYIADVRPERVADVVLDGTRAWSEQLA